MKKFKNLKLMLIGLLALGMGVAYAIDPVLPVGPEVGAQITVGNYVYTVTKQALGQGNAVVANGTVEMTEVAEGGQTVDPTTKSLIFDEDGVIEWTVGSKTYNFDITTMSSDLFRSNSYDAQHAVIPASFTEIPTGAFNTLTNLYDLTFAEGSQVTKIGTQAFASTQISSFDFSPCTLLEGLQDGVFVQTTTGDNNVNANITEITLPTSTAFKHINGAFRNLTALTTINNLENSWIRELIDDAFSGCESLKTLNLPGNDLLYISSKALEGSAVEELSINVGNGITNGNPMKLLGGCNVVYLFDEENQEYIYNYEDRYAEAVVDVANAMNEEIALENLDREAYNDANGLNENDEGFLAPLPEVNADEMMVPLVVDAETNLYGKNAKDKTPLKKLTIAGTLQGKICTNAFAWCNFIADATKATATLTPEFNVDDLQFGSKGQIETHAFYLCEKITELTLNDINDNKLDAGEYTIEANAFEGCPIATLNLGNIMTNNAIGSQAFGKDLVTVTIKTVKAASAAFEGYTAGVEGQDEVPATDAVYYQDVDEYNEDHDPDIITEEEFDLLTADQKIKTPATQGSPAVPAVPEVKGAFVFANVNGTTLNLATGATEYVSSDNPDANGKIIPEGVFDFSAVLGPNVTVWPVVNIGEIKSQGGVFAPGAIFGLNVDKMTFTGDVNTNGLDVCILRPEVYTDIDVETEYVSGNAIYDEEEAQAGTIWDGAGEPSVGDFAEGNTPGEYFCIETVTPMDPDGWTVTYYQAEVTKDALDQGDEEVGEEDSDEEAVGKWEKVGNVYKQIAERTTTETDTYLNRLSELTFNGKIKTNGVGAGAFIKFEQLAKLTFNGLLSKAAIANGSFTDAGKVNNDGTIGTAEAPFVTYTAALTNNDASENPFGTSAFAPQGAERIIYWAITNPSEASQLLATSIYNAIQRDADPNYYGPAVNPKFNVYKWVAVLPEEPEAAIGFIVFTDNKEITLDQNTDATLAWGRYDLGSFAEEGDVAGQDLEATDMIIPRYQTVHGLVNGEINEDSEYKVMVTLYGVYWDQNDNAYPTGLSSVYMVPLQVINGEYHIPLTNTHLIIAKVKNLEGEFAEDQILLGYTVPEADDDDDEPAEEPESAFAANDNSVWKQLQDETDGVGPVLDADAVAPMTSVQRIFKKADHDWTNQELCDEVENEGGAQNVTGKDLHVMLDPSKNAGFDVKRMLIERHTDGKGAYIGLGWYYALLNNYDGVQQGNARVIWLDYDQATAIFGVNAATTNAEANDNAVYNLQGIRVKKATKGVYIQNGQKVIVK